MAEFEMKHTNWIFVNINNLTNYWTLKQNEKNEKPRPKGKAGDVCLIGYFKYILATQAETYKDKDGDEYIKCEIGINIVTERIYLKIEHLYLDYNEYLLTL